MNERHHICIRSASFNTASVLGFSVWDFVQICKSNYAHASSHNIAAIYLQHLNDYSLNYIMNGCHCDVGFCTTSTQYLMGLDVLHMCIVH